MKCIYKGDDAPNLIEIELINDYGYQINKLITTCGKITHIYNNPVFPFSEGYTASETLQFDLENTFYAGVEIEGLGFRTFNGYLKFRACPQYVKREITNDGQINNNSNTPRTIRFELSDGIDIEAIFKIDTEETVWGGILGDITDQTDLIDLIDTKIDIETTARENNDLALQNSINTLNNDLTAEISNRGTADGILQGNIDTLSGTVTSNYNTLDGKIGNNKTSIDNHIADKNNPHEVTKAQVGLGNVDNTSDLDKPISTATQTALDGKVPTSRTVNSKALTSDIILTASDVGALSSTTTINDLTTAEQQSALNSGATSTNIGQIATNTQNISNEVTNRQNADNNLQSQIDALVVASDVFDIVGTYAELQAYDISTVPVNDIIKVLVDSTHNNAATYYRCVENDNVKSWSYIGAEGAYYTKSESDSLFVEQTTTINGQALSSNITLTASDVGALPDSTVIGNGTLTIQKNGSTIDSFGANDTGNTTVNISVPTDTGDLTNGAGYITGINSTDVINALGYTPYNGTTNPNGYQENVIETIKVNNVAKLVTDKAVNISVPTNTNELTNGAGFITGINSTDVTTALGYTPYDSTNPNGYTSNIGTVTSVNNVNPVNGNVSLTIPAQTDVKINNTSITSSGVANIVTNTAYNASSNKIATMSDLPSVANMQTTTNLVTSVSSSSTDSQYPSAKCVYDIVGDIETALNTINSGV